MGRQLCAMLLVGGLLTGCQDSTDPTSKPSDIQLNVANVLLPQLDSVQIVPSVLDESGTLLSGVPVTFESTAPALINVSNVGMIRSLGAAGNGAIVVKAGGFTKSVTVHVTQVPTRLVVAPNPGALRQRGTLQLSAFLLDKVDAPIPDAALTYSVGDPGVLTVSATGLVTSVGPAGSSIVSVQSGRFAAATTIAVAQVPTTLAFGSSKIFVALGSTGRIAASVRDAVGAPILGVPLQFESLQPAIVSVDGTGRISALGTIGSAAIRVSVVGTTLSQTVQVTVGVAASPTGVQLTELVGGGVGYVAEFVAGDSVLVLGYNGDLALYANTGGFRRLPTQGEGLAVTYDEDTHRSFIATNAGALLAYDHTFATFRQVYSGNGTITGLVLDRARRRLYSTQEGNLVVIDLGTLGVINTFSNVGYGLHITLNEQGTHAYLSGSGSVAEVDLSSGAVRRFNVPSAQATAVSKDGTQLFVASEAGGVFAVNIATGQATRFVGGCDMWGLSITRDGQFLYASCSGAGSVVIIDATSGSTVREHTGIVQPRRIQMSADGRTAAVGIGTGVLLIR